MHSLQTLLQRPPRQSNFRRSVFRLLQFTNETFTNRVVPPPQLKTWIPSTFHYEVTDILRSRMRTTHQHTCVASFHLLRNAVFCWYFSSVKNEPCGVAAGKNVSRINALVEALWGQGNRFWTTSPRVAVVQVGGERRKSGGPCCGLASGETQCLIRTLPRAKKSL